jgi:sporulation protein YlmC with PRC-barrel domain
MASEAIRQRADLLGTLVVTRNTGKKLGVISQLWVDIDQQEVVAISLKPSLFYGTPQPMLLSSIRQIGDVILVDDEDVIEDMDVEIYSNLINCEVITETGDLLGKVRGYKFDIDTGRLISIVIASLGVPLIPDQVVSTYELPIEEIISSGPDRLIVIEGAEQRLVQLSVGFMERMGIGRAPWERDDEDTYIAPVRVDNQLPSGVRQPVQTPLRERERQPVLQENWDDDNWGEPEPRQLRQQAYREPPQEPEPTYEGRGDRYADDDQNDANWNESENWSEASEPDQYKQVDAYADDQYDDDYDDDEFQQMPAATLEPGESEDPWAEPRPATSPAEYKPQPVNLPEKVKEKEPEYEE